MDQDKKFFQWKEGFKVGIEDIDQQHHSFLELLNSCYESIGKSCEADISVELVVKLKGYVDMHFRHEEEALELADYEGLERQRKQHMYFQTVIADLESVPQNAVMLKSTLTLLRDWFLHHILEEDMKYVPHLKQ